MRGARPSCKKPHRAYDQGMEKKRASETGIRIELPDGTHEAVAVDALVDDLLHGNTRAALKDLHEPYPDEPTPSDG